jgi:hypothetical protein
MTRGQDSFEIALDVDASTPGSALAADWPPRGLRVLVASEAERAAHDAALAGVAKDAKGTALWASAPAEG